MGNHKEKEGITVESLLQIKRSERPDGEFWESFDSSFQQRRLSALVEREPTGSAFFNPFVRVASIAFPVLVVAGLFLLWSPSQDVPDTVQPGVGSIAAAEPAPSPEGLAPIENPEEALPMVAVANGQISSQFVVDAIEDTSGNGLNFRKVLYTPAIHLSAPSGSFYIRDNLSSSRNYKVTTADVKLGRNF